MAAHVLRSGPEAAVRCRLRHPELRGQVPPGAAPLSTGVSLGSKWVDNLTSIAGPPRAGGGGGTEVHAMPTTQAAVHETLRSTSEALRRSLPDGSTCSTVFLGPCPIQAVACAVRGGVGGVGGVGYVEVLANATPTEQVCRW
jgi:hypothetical protein